VRLNADEGRRHGCSARSWRWHEMIGRPRQLPENEVVSHRPRVRYQLCSAGIGLPRPEGRDEQEEWAGPTTPMSSSRTRSASIKNALDRQSTDRDALLGMVNAYTSIAADGQGRRRFIAIGRKLFPDQAASSRNGARFRSVLLPFNPEQVVEERSKMLAADPAQLNNYICLGEGAAPHVRVARVFRRRGKKEICR